MRFRGRQRSSRSQARVARSPQDSLIGPSFMTNPRGQSFMPSCRDRGAHVHAVQQGGCRAAHGLRRNCQRDSGIAAQRRVPMSIGGGESISVASPLLYTVAWRQYNDVLLSIVARRRNAQDFAGRGPGAATGPRLNAPYQWDQITAAEGVPRGDTRSSRCQTSVFRTHILLGLRAAQYSAQTAASLMIFRRQRLKWMPRAEVLDNLLCREPPPTVMIAVLKSRPNAGSRTNRRIGRSRHNRRPVQLDRRSVPRASRRAVSCAKKDTTSQGAGEHAIGGPVGAIAALLSSGTANASQSAEHRRPLRQPRRSRGRHAVGHCRKTKEALRYFYKMAATITGGAAAARTTPPRCLQNAA